MTDVSEPIARRDPYLPGSSPIPKEMNVRTLYKLFKRAGAAFVPPSRSGFGHPMLRLGAYPIAASTPGPRRRPPAL